MKFRKPVRDLRVDNDYDFVRACVDLVERLPDEFEIVPDGYSCVKWPKEWTRDALLSLSGCYDKHAGRSNALVALAAIAPERKKRRVSLWEAPFPTGTVVKPADWAPRDHENWRKVAGPIEIDD